MALTRRTFVQSVLVGAGTVAFTPRRAWALIAPVLSGTVLGSTSVRLNWTDADNEQSYRVFQDSVLIQTLGANVLTTDVIGLTPNTTYNFRVDAKKGGTTVSSNTLPLTTQAGGPVTVAVTSGSLTFAGRTVTVTSSGGGIYSDTYGGTY